ncbi:MAG: Crp/Fnr family transcriptional regulator [Gammaproteobacteria bacterium]
MSAAYLPQQNCILRALPPEARRRVFPHLKLVEMPTGAVLYDSGDPLRDVHFPIDTVVAPLHVSKDERTAQIAVIGNDGMAGCSLQVGAHTALSETVVQCPGYAFRLSGPTLHQECARSGHLYGLVLRYTQLLIAHMVQTVVCNANHSLEQRLCRWLLLTMDRLPSNQLSIEQEVIEKVMGATPERVNETLEAFHSLGVIRRNLGRLTVADRHKLELAACECYSVLRTKVEPPQPPRTEKLADAFPDLLLALIDGLNATDQDDLVKQLEGALLRRVDFDLDADAGSIGLVAMYSPRAVRRNIFAGVHGRKIPVECQYWVNLDTDAFGRVTGIEILHPPSPLRGEMMDRARR